MLAGRAGNVDDWRSEMSVVRRTRQLHKMHASNGSSGKLKLTTGQDQRLIAGNELGDDPARRWFRMKFCEDLRGFRPEHSSYYKHYVHYFVTKWFSRSRVAGKRVLDFGCGPGFFSAILARRGALVTGIDLSSFLIEKANEHKTKSRLNNLEFIQGDFLSCSSRMASKSFDFVLVIDTLVSFDYSCKTHDHESARKAFECISRVMRDDGRCFVIESHPFFGQGVREITGDGGQCSCLKSPHYKIEYKLKADLHHWFTLDEMTRAINENGLAVCRIYEPDPAPALQKEDAALYSFRLKFPGMIVYEIRKCYGAGPEGALC